MYAKRQYMREPDVYLEDINTAIARIERHTKGLSRDDFEKNELVFDAVVRNLEIIGEATKRLPDAYKEQHPNIPWNKIA
jgi:uncharacterized protein with HEPN domain